MVEFFTSDLKELDETAIALVGGLISQLGRVRERELAARALETAADAAEAANRAKNTFLATMSHEIRTPMNAVMGMGELLLDTPLNEEQHTYTETIYNSAQDLVSIINDILDFSKVEAGKFDLEEVPVDLHKCVTSAFDLIAPRAREKEDLDLAYIIDPELPPRIVGDGLRLRQILINLLSNAVKFTDTGEVLLTATAFTPGTPGEAEGGLASGSAAGSPGSHQKDALIVHFAVRDSGVGIPADRIHQLFQPFEQLDSSTTRRYGGTGLGLAICRRLAELMGGTMWAESEPGRGSTFHFTIATRTAPAELRELRSEPRTALRGRRLLAVDDNLTNRMILARQGEIWGMIVRVTGSPEEALTWIRNGDPFDVGVLDMKMPHMDGITLAREISRHRKNLPMILLTSVGKPDADPDELGVFFALHTKPIKAERLYESICRALGRREPSGEQQAQAPTAPPRELVPLRILLAEDNLINQQLALRMLSKIGYSADAVTDGAQALQALRRKDYDVVLMDVHMPVMSGLDASRAIHRDWPEQQRPHIIALTASAMQEDREACLAAGMDDYLTKPLGLSTLAETLAHVRPRGAGPAPDSTQASA
ncbi:response regulator [Streptomyces sp. NPDC090073]|uniref:response regulator n=1 Tax=Streptomyces sp. NPDC090073 TaxID=3365936 RepID=UPI003816F5A3